MKIGVIGHNGRVGRLLIERGCSPIICDDIADYSSVERAIRSDSNGLVALLASKSDVDACQLPENKEVVIQTNLRGVSNVASVCSELKIGMVLLSTDHIFDGKRGPYKEGYKYYVPNLLGKYESPANFYGLSKMSAEILLGTYSNAKIVRTSYLFSADRLAGKCREPQPTFLYRSFMYAEHFAETFYEYLRRFPEMPKVLHISGSRVVNWYEFMLAYASVMGIDKQSIIPKTKDDAKQTGHAPRPHKAGLDVSLSKRLGLPQFDYLQGLKAMHDKEKIE